MYVKPKRCWRDIYKSKSASLCNDMSERWMEKQRWMLDKVMNEHEVGSRIDGSVIQSGDKADRVGKEDRIYHGGQLKRLHSMLLTSECTCFICMCSSVAVEQCVHVVIFRSPFSNILISYFPKVSWLASPLNIVMGIIAPIHQDIRSFAEMFRLDRSPECSICTSD